MEQGRESNFSGNFVHEFREIDDIPNETGIYVYEVSDGVVKCGFSGRLKNRCKSLGELKRIRESNDSGIRFAALPMKSQTDAHTAEGLFFKRLKERIPNTEMFKMKYNDAVKILKRFSKCDECELLMHNPEKDKINKENMEKNERALNCSSDSIKMNCILSQYSGKWLRLSRMVSETCRMAYDNFIEIADVIDDEAKTSIPANFKKEIEYYSSLIYTELIPLSNSTDMECWFTSKLPSWMKIDLHRASRSLQVAVSAIDSVKTPWELSNAIGVLVDSLFNLSIEYEKTCDEKLFPPDENFVGISLFFKHSSLAFYIGCYIIIALMKTYVPDEDKQYIRKQKIDMSNSVNRVISELKETQE